MSQKELWRSEVLSRVQRGEWKMSEAAPLLKVSYRQAKRLQKRYRAGGAPALVHGSVGRASNRAKPAAFREQVIEQVREHYGGGPRERFGPTLAAASIYRRAVRAAATAGATVPEPSGEAAGSGKSPPRADACRHGR